MLQLFLLGYLALNAFAFFYGERLIFLPRPRSYQDSPEILKLTTHSGEQISALYLPNPTATYTVLYSHGNAEDLGRIRQRLERLKNLGVSVFAYDYRGYGTSQGKPSEQNAYQDIEAAYRYLTVTLGISPNRIILYGRSLGSGTSVEIASREAIAGLILESPFTSTFRVITQIAVVPFDRFDNLRKIEKVRCPVLFLHGTQDGLIPFRHSEILLRQVRSSKQLVAIAGADHNDLLEIAGTQYNQAIQTFIQQLKHPLVPQP
ncbi:alpha/beta hydrolase [Leptolyngbya sp. Cla-17]|uniref:alpha/beta hydrolase n=1 Tax=Leptolyngbya sp. Cla-17 TaxID=2803751 RepID=UPI0018D989BA|nr:alpha/beta hydrolase [Leptolyngbya sp. Cla-17]